MKRRPRDLDALRDPGLARIRGALTSPASAEELAGEPQALAAYRATAWPRPSRRALWRPAVLSTVLATKLGAAAAAGAVGLSGAAAVAYTGNLPNGLQDLAHRAIKAPPAQAKGPDATGPAAYGLCQAFAKEKQQDDAAAQRSAAPKPTDRPRKGLGRGKGNGHGNGQANGPASTERPAKQHSVAYRNLVRAAGGEDKVAAYCASVPRPSGEPDAGEKPEKGKPTAAPAHPTGKPSADNGRRPSAPPSAESRQSATPEPTATEAPPPTQTG